MFHVEKYSPDQEKAQSLVLEQLKSLISDEPNLIANLANASALLNQFLTDVNWVGFYLAEGEELILGPFQGLPACIRIPFNRGVCGKAAAERRTIVVDDVHQFPGHIACDAQSASEIVVPLLKDHQLIGVLDIDSPNKGRFTDQDQAFLERFARALTEL